MRLTVEQVKLKRLSAEQWRAHLANDHLPFHRGCRTCLEGAGKARYHGRVVSPEGYTLAIDLAGPFKPHCRTSESFSSIFFNHSSPSSGAGSSSSSTTSSSPAGSSPRWSLQLSFLLLKRFRSLLISVCIAF